MNSFGRLITVTKNNTDNTKINKTTITRKQKRRKPILWILQETNERNLTGKDSDLIK